jgi:hypothetical protein
MEPTRPRRASTNPEARAAGDRSLGATFARVPCRALVAASLGVAVVLSTSAALRWLGVVGAQPARLLDAQRWALVAGAYAVLEAAGTRRAWIVIVGALLLPLAVDLAAAWTGGLLVEGSVESGLGAVEAAARRLWRLRPASALTEVGRVALPMLALAWMRVPRGGAPRMAQLMAASLAALFAAWLWIVATGHDREWLVSTSRGFAPLRSITVLTGLGTPVAFGWCALAVGLDLGDRLHARVSAHGNRP